MRARDWVVFAWLLLAGLFPSIAPSQTKPPPSDSAAATRALILISPDAAGPSIDPRAYRHPTWIVWPPDGPDDNGNQLLSLLTGADWAGSATDLSFDPLPGKAGWRSRGAERLAATGVLKARGLVVGSWRSLVLTGPRGEVHAPALLLGISGEGGPVQTQPLNAPIPPSRTLVLARADNWDDAAAIYDRVPGPSLVVEFPVPEAGGWARFWRVGQHWVRPAGTEPEDEVPVGDRRVPGLLDAREVGKLLMNPEGFRWQPLGENWPLPNAWLNFVRWQAPYVVGALAVLASLAVLYAVRAVSQERSSRPLARLLRAVLTLPAGLALGGSLCRFVSLEAWFVWLPLAMLATAALSEAASVVAERRQVSPLMGPALVTISALVAFSPTWTLLSGAFGWRQTGAPEELMAALLAALIWISTHRISGKLLMATVGGVGAFAGAWWLSEPYGVAVWTVSILIVLGVPIRRVALVSLVLALMALAWLGVAWLPGGLLHHAEEQSAINAVSWLQVLMAPGTVFVVAVGVFAGLFGDRFLLRQFKLLIRRFPGRMQLFHAALAILAWSPLFPAAFSTGLMLAVIATVVLLHDALLEL